MKAMAMTGQGRLNEMKTGAGVKDMCGIEQSNKHKVTIKSKDI